MSVRLRKISMCQRWSLIVLYSILSLGGLLYLTTRMEICCDFVNMKETFEKPKVAVRLHHHRRKITYSPEQLKRKETLNRYCSSANNVGSILSLRDPRSADLPHIFVSKPVDTVYCGIPKIASTNWKRILLKIAGQSKIFDTKKNRVHWFFLPKLFRDFHKIEITEILRYYYKFLFVRHPFERLVSTYRNKFRDRNLYFNRFYGSQILQAYRPNASLFEQYEGANVTFYEFARWLIEKRKYDAHWAPYGMLCHFCSLPYDFIGKYETLLEDSQQILRDMGVSKYLSFPGNLSDGYAVSSRDLARTYFSLLPNETIDQLYEIYKEDFLAFGYDKNL